MKIAYRPIDSDHIFSEEGEVFDIRRKHVNNGKKPPKHIPAIPSITATAADAIHVSLAASLSAITQNHLTAALAIHDTLAGVAQTISPRTATSALAIHVSLAAELHFGSQSVSGAMVIHCQLVAAAQVIAPHTLTSDLTIDVLMATAESTINPIVLLPVLEIHVSLESIINPSEPIIGSMISTIEVSLSGTIMTQAAPYPLEGDIHPQPRRGFEDLDYRPERYIR